MTYPRVSPGSSVISSRLLNDTAKLLESFERGDYGSGGAVVMAKNATEGSFSGEINVVSLIPDEAPVGAEVSGDVCAKAVKPDGIHPLGFVTVLHPNQVAPAQTSGVVVIDVKFSRGEDIEAIHDMRADAIVDETRFLQSMPGGRFEILAIGAEHTVGEETVRRALVRVDCNAPELYIATSDDTEGKVNLKRVKITGEADEDAVELEEVPTFAPTATTLRRNIRTGDICMMGGCTEHKAAAIGIIGAADALKEIPAGTTATAETTEWKIEEQPEGKRGVNVKAWFRLFWSGTEGDPVYAFTREGKWDSKGNLIYVGAEVRSTAFGTGACD